MISSSNVSMRSRRGDSRRSARRIAPTQSVSSPDLGASNVRRRACTSNPTDGESPTAQRVIATDDDRLADLWPAAPTAPLVINVPAAPTQELAT